MKQFLRSFLTLLLLMMWGSVGFAQTTIWSEDWTGQKYNTNPSKVSSMYTQKNSQTRTYNEARAGGITPELLLQKDDTWSVTISDLKGCNNSFTLSFKTNRHDTKKYISVTANGKTISCPQEGKTSTHSGTFELNVATGKNLVLIFKANGDNCRIDDIKLTGTPAESKPTLTFSETEKTVYKGSESTFTMPTLVLKDKDGKEVTSGVDYLYEVTDANPEGCLGVDMITGKITFNELGTANIKVTTSTTDSGSEFNNLTASYILNYKKIETTLTLSKASVSVNLGETPELPTCTLKAGDEIITNKTLSYTITPEGIANIDPTTGELTLISAGEATVNVSFTGDETYEASNIASYDLTVVDPNAPLDNIVFDAATKGFDDMYYDNAYPSGTKNAAFKSKDGKTYAFSYSNCMRNNAKNYNPDVIQVRNKSNNMGYFTSSVFDEMPNGYKVNVYYGIADNNTPLTITSNEESSATSISNAYGDKDRLNGTGYCTSIILANGSSFTVNVGGSTCYVSKIEILPLSAPLTLEEDADDTNTKIEKNNGKTQDVILTRSLKAGAWNTICLPFDVTADQVESVLKATDNVKEFDKEDKATATIFFKPATEMKAGVPYLIKPTEDATVLNFKGVTINNVDKLNRKNGNDYCICGVFGKYTMKTDGTELFLNAAGKFVAPAAATNTMKGFRAYFMVPSGSSAAALNINIDGETTGINSIETEAAVNGKVYNLNGQYVGNSLNGLKKGIYVVNGKKVIK